MPINPGKQRNIILKNQWSLDYREMYMYISSNVHMTAIDGIYKLH